MTDIIPMKRFVFCVLCVYIVNVSGNEKTPLITSYAKVSMSGNSNYNGTNEGRSYLAGQTLWTQRTDAHVSKQQNPIHRVYPQQYPIYNPPKEATEKLGYSNEKLPAKGEVIIEDRFTLSRPYFTYDPEKKKPDLSYLPPPKTESSPPVPQPLPPPPPPPSAPQSLPPPPPKDVQPPTSPDKPNQTPDTGPTGLYDSPYSSYNPPNLPPSYFYPKPDDQKNSNPVYPPLATVPDKMEDKKPPYLEYKPSSGYLPPYLEYNPNDVKPSDHHHHDHHHDMDHHHEDMMPPPDNKPEEMKPPEPMPPPDMKPPTFPAYLYNHPTGPDDSKSNMIPPYLEYNPYEHKPSDDDKGPQITPTITSTGEEHYPKLPPYLDHDPHSFLHDFYHFPLYHEIKPITPPPPPTTTVEPEKRDSKRPYTYYYLGRKLWYIPLYFSVYFITYVFVLVLKSIARHKITFNQYFEDSRKFNGDETMEDITERVLTTIENATEKYNSD